MRNPQKQTALGRNTESGSRSPSARSDHYTTAGISASIYSGRTLLGFVIDEPGHTVALTPSRELIGLFPDRRAATLAILLEQRRASTPA